MLRILAALAVTLAVGMMIMPADADPPGRGHKSAKHAHKKVWKAKKISRYSGGPPPWAPAHGYRRKAGYYDNLRYRDYGLPAPPIDLGLGRCNREVLGQVVGGGLGALAGSQIGSGDGRLVAVAAGTIIGVLVGGEVGRHMDRTDALCIDQALEAAPDGETIIWNNNRENYSVTPLETVVAEDNRYCREYIAQSTVGGQVQQVYGTACRQPDGSWQLVGDGR